MTLRELKNQLGDQPLKGRTFCVSVSGGVDSMVLLDRIRALSRQEKFFVSAVHVNFQLRGRHSQRDEDCVRAYCQRADIPLTIRRVRLTSKTGIQESARSERLKALKTLPETWEILEAHHADDQRETFLLRLFRGAGVKGLSGMSAVSMREGRRVFRPWLSVKKSKILQMARRFKVPFRQDQSNLTDQYDRNFIRLKLWPLIDRRFSSAERSLMRTMELLRAWDGAIDIEVDQLLRECPRDGFWNREVLRGLPLILLQEVLCRWFQRHRLGMLSMTKSRELAHLIRADSHFRFNAPRGNWVCATLRGLEFVDAARADEERAKAR